MVPASPERSGAKHRVLVRRTPVWRRAASGHHADSMWRSVLVSIAGVVLLAGVTEAQAASLRAPRRLTATAVSVSGRPAVRLRWRDAARGETRWEVLRGRRRVILRAGRTHYTDRRVTAGARYRYRVRACRRHRCGRWASARIAVPAAPGTPGAPG